jgi:hypothetical protein
MDKLLLGEDDSFGSPIERIFIAANSAEGCDNPQRQGLSADLADGHRPNNILAEFRRSRWTTVRPGTHSCTRGPMMQYQGVTVSNGGKSSKFSPMRKMA